MSLSPSSKETTLSLRKSHLTPGSTHLLVQLLEELNLIHQRFNLAL